MSKSDTPSLLQIAESLLRDGDAEGALHVYGDVLALSPREGDALIGKGRALVALNRDAQAIRFLERATELQPGSAVAWMLLGTAALGAGDGEIAGRAFSTLQNLGIEPAENYLNLARAAYYSLDVDASRDYIQLSLAEDPKNEQALAWQQALDSLNSHAAFLIDVGRSHCRRKRFEQGLNLFTKALAEEDTYDGHLYGGRALLALGRHNEAVVELQKGSALRPDDTTVLKDLAMALALDGKGSEADETYDRILAAEPDSVEALVGKANLAVAQETDALSQLVDRLLKLAPERPETWILQGWRLKAEGQRVRARLSAERGIARNVFSAEGWVAAAGLLDELGHIALARMCQEKALFEASGQTPEEQPRDAASLPGIDDESAALDALELQPTEMVEALQNRAIMYAALGELKRGLHYLDMALTRFPRLETEELQRHRGVILNRLGETDRAREAFSRALEIDSSSNTAQDYLEALGTA